MSRNAVLALIAVLVIAGGGMALWLSRAGAPHPDVDAEPIASITTAVVRSETLKDVTIVYGVVQADPAGTTTLAAPRAVIVSRILVLPEQTVAAGQALIEVASAPAADLAYHQAADAADFARKDLARVQRLFDAHLAASDQLNTANKTLADAQSALAAQRKQGAGRERQTLTAPAASVVTSIAAAPGEHVAQDAPLMTLVRQGAIGVRLGLDPSARHVTAGLPVTIHPMGGGPAIASRLKVVGRTAEPAGRTIDTFAPLGSAAPPIGSAVEAEVATGEHPGLTVPRAAVVFDETGSHVFVISGGKARRVFVTTLRAYDDRIEVRGPLAAVATVAVQGAYELQDGMAVRLARP
jgi:RND family efflux transporter MFP subunit